MKVGYGKGKTEYGLGIQIDLDGNEIACAIDAYLMANDIYVAGARTVTVNGRKPRTAMVYVDPSGYVMYKGKKFHVDKI